MALQKTKVRNYITGTHHTLGLAIKESVMALILGEHGLEHGGRSKAR